MCFWHQWANVLQVSTLMRVRGLRKQRRRKSREAYQDVVKQLHHAAPCKIMLVNVHAVKLFSKSTAWIIAFSISLCKCWTRHALFHYMSTVVLKGCTYKLLCYILPIFFLALLNPLNTSHRGSTHIFIFVMTLHSTSAVALSWLVYIADAASASALSFHSEPFLRVQLLS